MFGWLPRNPLPVGTKAPDFMLPTQASKKVELSALRGQSVVLVFYPGDDTTVCTRQLCEFRDQWKDAETRNVLVFGVNPAGDASHRRFRDKYRFPFPILVDERRRIASLYRCGGLIVRRTVYLIGTDGLIRYAMRGKPQVSDVLIAAYVNQM